MSSIPADNRAPVTAPLGSIQETLVRLADELAASVVPCNRLSAAGRRMVIARYAAVLEGNFIYWMSGAYLSARTEQARRIIQSNLLEEVRDCHPGMLRKFVMRAHAVPSESDALAIYAGLTKVRMFVARLSPAPIIAMMAFFEEFIRRFMPYLAELATEQGSEEQEYTRTHAECDAGHAQELFHALEAELSSGRDGQKPADYLFEGVHLLRALLQTVIAPRPV